MHRALEKRLRAKLPAEPNGPPPSPGEYAVETLQGELLIAEQTQHTLWTFGRAVGEKIRRHINLQEVI